ncbi:MAG: dipeptidase [Anaerolineales bacterium]|jgi:acetylornithine deacetylase/succinyl-diaminopimelate desuccinylase-like protein
MTVETALAYAESHHSAALDQLAELLRIPTVSTASEHAADMVRGAEWIADRLRKLGLTAEVAPTAGHPVVLGEYPGAGKGAPTLLVYGHYDVQPADPVGEWISPPFEPTIRGEDLFARGASDMKGQLVAHLAAVEAIGRTGSLPVNLIYLVEGEEEIGSPNMESFIQSHRDRLACDVVLNLDSMILRPDLPSIVYGLRGLAYFELRVYGPAHDLHSGQFGGAVHNPAQVLCELINGMHDRRGRVTLPGFYDKVRPLGPEEREALALVPEREEDLQRMTGVPRLWGEKGYTVVERLGARPTLEVNGLLSGFTGEGSKTVLPSTAMAKISMRLVPDQTPDEVHAQLLAYLRREAPATVRWEVTSLAGGLPAIVRRNTEEMRAAARALTETFGRPPVFVREGGSIHVVSLMQSLLGRESILMGFSLPDDNLHAPNEKLHVPNFYRGIEAYIRFAYGLVR